MNVLLFLSYLFVLYIYYILPIKIIILNRNFKELINRTLGALLAIIALYWQQKDNLSSIDNMFIFYAVIFLALIFVLLLAFIGNNIDYSNSLNINHYDIIAAFMYTFIISLCFLFYAGFDIYPFTPILLFIINIVFCLWMGALFLINHQKRSD